jgi:hypothetical protein
VRGQGGNDEFGGRLALDVIDGATGNVRDVD